MESIVYNPSAPVKNRKAIRRMNAQNRKQPAPADVFERITILHLRIEAQEKLLGINNGALRERKKLIAALKTAMKLIDSSDVRYANYGLMLKAMMLSIAD